MATVVNKKCKRCGRMAKVTINKKPAQRMHIAAVTNKCDKCGKSTYLKIKADGDVCAALLHQLTQERPHFYGRITQQLTYPPNTGMTVSVFGPVPSGERSNLFGTDGERIIAQEAGKYHVLAFVSGIALSGVRVVLQKMGGSQNVNLVESTVQKGALAMHQVLIQHMFDMEVNDGVGLFIENLNSDKEVVITQETTISIQVC